MYNSLKAAQAAAYLLNKAGGQLRYIKLLKLLYIADRIHLGKRGSTITNDHYVSMKFGPVPSVTYDLAKQEIKDASWDSYINRCDDYRVELAQPINEEDPLDQLDELSPAEQKTLDQVFDEYGHMPAFGEQGLCELTHQFAEWKHNTSSSIPITLEEMLTAQGYNDEAAKDIAEDIRSYQHVDELIERISAQS